MSALPILRRESRQIEWFLHSEHDTHLQGALKLSWDGRAGGGQLPRQASTVWHPGRKNKVIQELR